MGTQQNFMITINNYFPEHEDCLYFIWVILKFSVRKGLSHFHTKDSKSSQHNCVINCAFDANIDKKLLSYRQKQSLENN